MIQEAAKPVPLVTRLIELAEKEDRGALAALRTGVGKPPGTASRMWPVVAPFLGEDQGPSVQAAFVTASLFATHPEQADIGSLGTSLWRATKSDDNPGGKHGRAGVEARFAAALDAAPADLPRHLEGLVSLCANAGVPIDWHLFFRDIRGLLGRNESYQTRIRTRWARDFWRGPSKSDDPTASTEEENEE